MTWNKPTLHSRFSSLDQDTRDALTDFLFARFMVTEYADGSIDTQPLKIVLKRAMQLFNNPEKMGATVTAECPECKARFRMAPEDPLYICPNCAHELDRCEWLADMVYDYMKREILDALIECEPAKADDLLKKADNIPDQRFTSALVATFRISFLESLRNNGVQISDEFFERTRAQAVALSWAGILEIFQSVVEGAASPSESDDHKEGEHESSAE